MTELQRHDISTLDPYWEAQTQSRSQDATHQTLSGLGQAVAPRERQAFRKRSRSASLG